MAFSPTSEVDDLLNEHESDSQLSVEVSFTLDDILNEKLSQTEDEDDDAAGLFSDGENSEDNPATKSQSSKEVEKVTSKVVNRQEELVVRRHTRIADTPLSQELLNQNLQYSTLSTVSRLFDASNTSIVGVGVPCCLSASKKFLAVGTSLSNIALFEVGVRQHKLLQPDISVNYGAATSVEISRDSKYMVCGFTNGAVTLWDLSYFVLAKTIPLSGGHPVTKVTFCSDSYSEFVSVDAEGNVFLHTVQKYVWVSVRSKRLVSRAAGVLYHDVRAAAFRNGRWFLALACADFVLVVTLQPTIEVVAKLSRPLEFSNTKIPNVEFGKLSRNGELADVLLVSWGSTVNIYHYDSASRLDQFSQIGSFRHDQAVFGMRSLSESMLLLYDSSNHMQLFNLIINQTVNKHELSAELLSQKHYKDKLGKPLKNCSNTLCQCLTADNRQVLLVGKDSVLRGRLFRWSEFVSMLIGNRQWREALKLLMQLFDGKMDIFADRVTITPHTILLFQDMLLAYARTRLVMCSEAGSPSKTNMQGMDHATEIRDTLEGCIEFCLHCRMEEFLFGELHDQLAREFATAEQFLVCLEPFIENDLIRKVPNRRMYAAIVEYYASSRSELVDRLVSHVDRDSIDYALTVELCQKLHLYNSLIYVSELHEDFITPANRLLQAAQTLSRQSQCLELLYTMVRLVGQGKSITGAALSSKLTRIGVRVLLQWYLLEETYKPLLAIDSSKYFEELAQFLTSQAVGESMDELKQLHITDSAEKLRQFLTTNNRQDQLKELSACLIHANLDWPMDLQTRLFCLQHLHPRQSMDDLAQFISRNYQFIKELPNWGQVAVGLPPEIQALIAIEDNNMPLALQQLQRVHLNDQSRRRLFQRISRYHFSGNVEAMANLDCYRTAQFLMDQYAPEEISREIEKIHEPFLKYSLVRRVMRLDQQSRVEWSRPLLLFYLQSLCLYRPEKRVLHELRKHIFPIEEALAIVSKRCMQLCQAYLSQPQQAVDLYQLLYQKVFMRNYHKLETFEYCNCRDLKYIFQELLHLLKGGLLEISSEHWFRLLETVLNPLKQPTSPRSRLTVADSIQKFYKKKGNEQHPFFVAFFSILQRTLLEVSMHTTIDALTRELQSFLSVLNVGFVLNSFRATLQTYNRQGQLYRISGKLLLKDMIGNFEEIMEQNTQGIPSSENCTTCHNEVFGGDSYLFPCGHTFHRKCLDRLKCPTCAIERFEIQPTPQRTMHRRADHPTTRFSTTEEDDQQLLYSLMGFDQMVAEEQSQMENFTTLYDSFMLLY